MFIYLLRVDFLIAAYSHIRSLPVNINLFFLLFRTHLQFRTHLLLSKVDVQKCRKLKLMEAADLPSQALYTIFATTVKNRTKLWSRNLILLLCREKPGYLLNQLKNEQRKVAAAKQEVIPPMLYQPDRLTWGSSTTTAPSTCVTCALFTFSLTTLLFL